MGSPTDQDPVDCALLFDRAFFVFVWSLPASPLQASDPRRFAIGFMGRLP
jgi:hypothetical protein